MKRFAWVILSLLLAMSALCAKTERDSRSVELLLNVSGSYMPDYEIRYKENVNLTTYGSGTLVYDIGQVSSLQATDLTFEIVDTSFSVQGDNHAYMLVITPAARFESVSGSGVGPEVRYQGITVVDNPANDASYSCVYPYSEWPHGTGLKVTFLPAVVTEHRRGVGTPTVIGTFTLGWGDEQLTGEGRYTATTTANLVSLW